MTQDTVRDNRWMAARRFAKTLSPEQSALLDALMGDQSPETISTLISTALKENELWRRSASPRSDVLTMAVVDYALGRMTYASAQAVDEVIEKWDALARDTRKQIVEKVEKAIKAGMAGMSCDVAEWRRIVDRAHSDEMSCLADDEPAVTIGR